MSKRPVLMLLLLLCWFQIIFSRLGAIQLKSPIRKSSYFVCFDGFRSLFIITSGKNSAFLHVIACKSLEEEYDPASISKGIFGSFSVHFLQKVTTTDGLEDPSSNVALYVLLRAAYAFQSKFGHFPGQLHNGFEEDVATFKAEVVSLMAGWGLATSISDDLVLEMCRCGAAELHSVAAFIGGTLE
jgi:amyloid beta precursor protein binding protein 1